MLRVEMLSALTKRINEKLGDLYLHGWQISGPHSAKDTPMSGPDITLLPIHARHSSGRVALLTWRINDGRGELVFSVCFGAGWHRRNADFRIACYHSDALLTPADFPEWFERSQDDDWWRLRESAICRVPLIEDAPV